MSLRFSPSILASVAGLALALCPGCGVVVESWQAVNLLDEGDRLADMVGANDCMAIPGHRLHSYVSPTPQASELNVIGVYTSSDPTFQEVTVEVTRTTTSTLVLAAYQPTKWVVRMWNSGRIDRVIATGYHRQDVVLEGFSTETSTVTYEDDQDMLGVGYSWHSGGVGDGECEEFLTAAQCRGLGESWRLTVQEEVDQVSELVANAEASTGLELTSFHGCFGMSDIILTDTRTAEELAAGGDGSAK